MGSMKGDVMNIVKGQHGDVVLVKENKLPYNFKGKKAKKGFIVEKGEGVHTHEILDGDCYVDEIDGVMWLNLKSPTKITHEEHGVKILEPGIYRKEIENEFDYEAMEARKTRD